MLSYSRARGVFAGVSLEGSTLRPDEDANRRVYGKDVAAVQIIAESRVQAPGSARELVARLQQASARLKQ
jgi:lipid-binding SYLF domain-containing protein